MRFILQAANAHIGKLMTMTFRKKYRSKVNPCPSVQPWMKQSPKPTRVGGHNKYPLITEKMPCIHWVVAEEQYIARQDTIHCSRNFQNLSHVKFST